MKKKSRPPSCSPMSIGSQKYHSESYGLLLAIYIYVCINYSILIFNEEIIHNIVAEDGLIESLGALYFFLAFILYFMLFNISKRGNILGFPRTTKRVFYALLAILFLFAAGEEISWGQRFFDVATPKAWEAINAQKELTIHNLKFLQGSNGRPLFNVIDLTSMNTLFIVFSLGFCFFIPLLSKFNIKFSKWQNHIGFPLVPLNIGIVFVVSFAFSTIIRFHFSDRPVILHADTEIRESIWAFLYLMIAILLIKKEEPPAHG